MSPVQPATLPLAIAAIAPLLLNGGRPRTGTVTGSPPRSLHPRRLPLVPAERGACRLRARKAR